MGAGAVGCYFGGLLARAGHDVTFVGRAGHVDAINRRGLLLEIPAFNGYVKARAVTDASSVESSELVLFCVKSNDTESAGESLSASLRPETLVVSLQNGVDNAERLSSVIGQHVIPAVVYVGAEMAGLGHVRHHGRGELVIGASPKSHDLALELSGANIPTTITSNIEEALWVKLITNCAYNALSAVARISYGPMLKIDGVEDVMASVVQECVTVARSCGVSVPDDILTRVLGVGATMPGQLSSTAQDLARGKHSEIDFINGYVVRKGAEKRIPTPTNQALQVMVKLAEHGGALRLDQH